MARKVLHTYDIKGPTHVTNVLRVVLSNYYMFLCNYREKIGTINRCINNETTILVKVKLFGKKL